MGLSDADGPAGKTVAVRLTGPRIDTEQGNGQRAGRFLPEPSRYSGLKHAEVRSDCCLYNY